MSLLLPARINRQSRWVMWQRRKQDVIGAYGNCGGGLTEQWPNSPASWVRRKPGKLPDICPAAHSRKIVLNEFGEKAGRPSLVDDSLLVAMAATGIDPSFFTRPVRASAREALARQRETVINARSLN